MDWSGAYAGTIFDGEDGTDLSMARGQSRFGESE